MPKFKLVALSSPKAGREAEFHQWYQGTHLPEMVAFAGMQGAQRFELVAKLMGADDNKFLAIYDIECDDPRAFLGAVGKASAEGRLTRGEASDMSTTYTALFRELDVRVTPKK
jgi:hypothetical protein